MVDEVDAVVSAGQPPYVARMRAFIDACSSIIGPSNAGVAETAEDVVVCISECDDIEASSSSCERSGGAGGVPVRLSNEFDQERPLLTDDDDTEGDHCAVGTNAAAIGLRRWAAFFVTIDGGVALPPAKWSGVGVGGARNREGVRGVKGVRPGVRGVRGVLGGDLGSASPVSAPNNAIQMIVRIL